MVVTLNIWLQHNQTVCLITSSFGWKCKLIWLKRTCSYRFLIMVRYHRSDGWAKHTCPHNFTVKLSLHTCYRKRTARTYTYVICIKLYYLTTIEWRIHSHIYLSFDHRTTTNRQSQQLLAGKMLLISAIGSLWTHTIFQIHNLHYHAHSPLIICENSTEIY